MNNAYYHLILKIFNGLEPREKQSLESPINLQTRRPLNLTFRTLSPKMYQYYQGAKN
jgi:hypothetical protein